MLRQVSPKASGEILGCIYFPSTFLSASLFLISEVTASLLMMYYSGIKSYITSRAVRGGLFLVLLSMPAAILLIEFNWDCVVFVLTAFPQAIQPYVSLGSTIAL